MLTVKAKIVSGIFLVAFLLLLTQCRDNAATVDPNFVGIWTGTDAVSSYRLTIDHQSNAYWVRDASGKYESAQGIARVRHGELHIGAREFDINEYPILDSSGIWTMILEGVVYYK